jgi:hypothetical protein
MWPRILPFGLYMAFLGLESLLYSASAWVPFLAESGALLPISAHLSIRTMTAKTSMVFL